MHTFCIYAYVHICTEASVTALMICFEIIATTWISFLILILFIDKTFLSFEKEILFNLIFYAEKCVQG